MQFDIITIFPKVFEEYFNTSIIGRAQKKKLVSIKTHDLRKFTADKHKNVDDKPYGGGAGMVLMAEPIIKSIDKIKSKKHPLTALSSSLSDLGIKGRASKKTKTIIFSAKGKQFTQKMALNYAKNYDQLIMVTGRYEGIDERVKTITKAEEVSIGPYVLTDGELPAMILVSAITRLLPNVINFASLQEESFWNNLLDSENKQSGVLEYPHYTRPEVIKYKGKNYRVPKILLSGHHAAIKKWRATKTT